VCKFGGDPTICLREVMVSANSVGLHCVHCGQTDCNTSLPRAGEVIKLGLVTIKFLIVNFLKIND